MNRLRVCLSLCALFALACLSRVEVRDHPEPSTLLLGGDVKRLADTLPNVLIIINGTIVRRPSLDSLADTETVSVEIVPGGHTADKALLIQTCGTRTGFRVERRRRVWVETAPCPWRAPSTAR